MAPRGLSTLLEVRFFASGLESAAAQPSKFLTANGHEWTRINPDKAGETASRKVRPYNESFAAPSGLVSESTRVYPWFNCRFYTNVT